MSNERCNVVCKPGCIQTPNIKELRELGDVKASIGPDTAYADELEAMLLKRCLLFADLTRAAEVTLEKSAPRDPIQEAIDALRTAT